MRPRRERRKHLNVEYQIEYIHDDLDQVDAEVKGMRKENRALVVGIVIAIIATGIWL